MTLLDQGEAAIKATARDGEPAAIVRDLVFDIGVNHGEDSDHYLAKGFRVVGVEADPVIAERLRQGFQKQIASGQMAFEHVGLMPEPGVLPFYRNLDCDHWSSFIESYGCRNGSRFEVVDVSCVTLAHLIAKYGCPYYMKIDVEGADRLVLDQLERSAERPVFISIEEFGLASLEALGRLGYNRFSLRTQLDKSWAVPPNPPLEGRYAPREFGQRDSGLFGLEIPGWAPLDKARKQFFREVRDETGAFLPKGGEWYDIHATYWPSQLDEGSIRQLRTGQR
jgi:FkbM family methyltransferase